MAKSFAMLLILGVLAATGCSSSDSGSKNKTDQSSSSGSASSSGSSSSSSSTSSGTTIEDRALEAAGLVPDTMELPKPPGTLATPPSP